MSQIQEYKFGGMILPFAKKGEKNTSTLCSSQCAKQALSSSCHLLLRQLIDMNHIDSGTRYKALSKFGQLCGCCSI